MNWSPYQQEIFRQIKESQDNLVIVARAGSGKTTTIVEGLYHLPETRKVLMCAFNKGIQVELAERAPEYVEVKTTHSLGFEVCRRQLGRLVVEKDKTRNIIKALCAHHHTTFDTGDGIGKVLRLVSLAKNTLSGVIVDATNEEDVMRALCELQELAEEYDLDETEYPADQMAAISLEVLEVSRNIQADNIKDEKGEILIDLVDDKGNHFIDFDDMIWLPAVHELLPSRYNTVVVDETQDLNAPQVWLIRQALRDGGRLIAVGDDKQAIYGWRGAGSDVMPSLIQDFKAKILPLPVTYRCPLSVVKKAQEVVPDLEPWAEALPGIVDQCTLDTMINAAKPGDFILSRKNAPLMGTCVALLRLHKPAVVAGRDIGKSLSDLAKKSKKRMVPELILWLQEYLRKEKERLEPQGKKRRIEFIKDKVTALMVLTEGLSTTEQVVNRIHDLFRDDSDAGKIVCSTVHKAKGLERKRVWMLADTFNVHGAQEERNIWYVAVTRAQNELHFVFDPNYRQRFGR